MQVINAGQVLFFGNKNQGSFAAMLLLESVLEHGQPWVLVTALCFDGNFTSVLLKILASVCPLCCNPSNLKVTWSMVKNPHIPDCDPCTVSTPNVGSDSN